jgi:hypothetical protein
LDSANCSGRKITALATLNTAVVAPIPSARVSRAAAENPGLRRSMRRPKRRSCRSDPVIIVFDQNDAAHGENVWTFWVGSAAGQEFFAKLAAPTSGARQMGALGPSQVKSGSNEKKNEAVSHGVVSYSSVGRLK